MPTIGTAAKRAGCNVETVRYYERIGLLKPPPRPAAGRRTYGKGEIEQLCFIRRCRELGFALKDIQVLIGLSSAGERNCSRAKQMAELQVDLVRKKMADLIRVEAWLQTTIAECGASQQDSCPLIEKLGTPSAALIVDGHSL